MTGVHFGDGLLDVELVLRTGFLDGPSYRFALMDVAVILRIVEEDLFHRDDIETVRVRGTFPLVNVMGNTPTRLC